MEDLSLHILDIVENSLNAGASNVSIKIVEDDENFIATIVDNGKGMDEETLKNIFDPFFTTKNARNFGFGIPLFAQTAEQCGGRLDIKSKVGFGTEVSVYLKKNHIDMLPIGDLGLTIITLIISNPEVNYQLIYKNGNYIYELDTAELKSGIDSITEAQTLNFIRNHINDGIKSTQNQR